MDITERKRAEFHLHTEHHVTQILTSGGQNDSVLVELLQMLCTRLNMLCAVHWVIEPHGLTCRRVWCSDKVDRSDRVHLQMETAGSELARLAAQKRELVIAADLPLNIAPAYTSGGGDFALHSAAALPIVTGNKAVGVIELCSEGRVQVDASLADLLASISAQLGQYHQKALAEKALKYVPAHDALTGLPNRIEFRNRLSLALKRARRERLQIAILLVDLDGFALLNDSLGHGAGDKLLQECANRIVDSLRQGDTVARMGEDEFAVMLEGVDKGEHISTAVRKLLQRLKEPFVVDARQFTPSASIGISIYPADGIEAGTLLKHADMAIYRAKQQGRGSYRFFSASMNEEMERRGVMEASLRRAVERDEFVLHYEPRMSAKTGRITGVEALIRWKHPELGLVAQPDFSALAEQTDLIVPIGEWALRTACEQACAWQLQGLGHLRMSVNLSARQFAQATLSQEVGRVLQSTRLAPESLELEVAETLVVRNPAQAAQTLHELKRMGVGLSMDQFGTGGSSLSYLKMFPFEGLKLDRSFVDGIPAEREDLAVAAAVIDLAHALGMRAIAEGVQTQEQAQWLGQSGCEEMQGHFVGKPMPGEALTPMLLEFGSRESAMFR
jgi:diguanylate cyclase (GGDEF)-like protein